MQISKDKVVTIEYTMTDEAGKMVDTTDNRDALSFIQGSGQLIPALEQALEGHSSGEQLQITLPPEQGYGERDERLVKEIPRSQFQVPGEIELGMLFQAQNGDHAVPVTVVKFDEETVTIDANPQLAGTTLSVDIVIVEVRDAIAEELESGEVQEINEIYQQEMARNKESE
ncbi:peptidylprolyl isomerase [Solemya pervernicosa gill symbiont]|uniref:Peptidyl-prolyl cis-trans isomerase n=2 Tax=Gammaproteobacteria incertae sedis TaxID=118884 RepID=A0A1T2L0Y2_9GAMM|nr:peptidylprolyl isomerase [Candidatus Reidiella endopervernicosa]OOZ38670.1 peptidylprolyl isomerase [Solemya pervernicosa gill symbiont]QKQ25180.1 peptidylprolyl isomerase [Candidatus Reidiella endopervernicosa]